MMTSQAYMPKSKSDIHITPERVYQIIRKRWGYKKDEMFDPCPVNPDFDGLSIPWQKINFVNPPYTLLKEFVKKADDETKLNHESVLLLPVKSDQQWFHDSVVPRLHDVEFIIKRLRFVGNKFHATQPHFLVKFNTTILKTY